MKHPTEENAQAFKSALGRTLVEARPVPHEHAPSDPYAVELVFSDGVIIELSADMGQGYGFLTVTEKT